MSKVKVDVIDGQHGFVDVHLNNGGVLTIARLENHTTHPAVRGGWYAKSEYMLDRKDTLMLGMILSKLNDDPTSYEFDTDEEAEDAKEQSAPKRRGRPAKVKGTEDATDEA